MFPSRRIQVHTHTRAHTHTHTIKPNLSIHRMVSDTLWMNNTALPHPPGSLSDSKTPSISSQGKARVLWSHQGEHRAVITKSAVSVSSALVYSGLSTPDGFTVSSSCLFSLLPGDTGLSDLPANEARGHCHSSVRVRVHACVCVCPRVSDVTYVDLFS